MWAESHRQEVMRVVAYNKNVELCGIKHQTHTSLHFCLVWCDSAVSHPEWRREDAKHRPQLPAHGRQSMVSCLYVSGVNHFLSLPSHLHLCSCHFCRYVFVCFHLCYFINLHWQSLPVQDWVGVFSDKGVAQHSLFIPLSSPLHPSEPSLPPVTLRRSAEAGAVAG